jgi:hypothetical protein
MSSETAIQDKEQTASMTVIKTKRKCRELGLLPALKWYVRRRCPRTNAVGITVKGETFYAANETEELVSDTEPRRRNLKPAGVPVTQFYSRFNGRGVRWDAYRISDCVPLQKRTSRPAQGVDLLQAVFAVNRSAKRYRDAATKHYSRRPHGFAQHCKQVKLDLYELKDHGIVAACKEGRLRYDGQNGGYALYRGEGYCFHSLLVPEEAEVPTGNADELITIEAKPRKSGDARLRDAEHTLESLSVGLDGFRYLQHPQHERSVAHGRFCVFTGEEEDDEDDGWECEWDDELVAAV